jgi:3-hydroxyisobutyrate dehydrogenase
VTKSIVAWTIEMDDAMTQPRIALLGLGIMGSGMAGRLLGARFPLTVYNRTPDKAKPIVELGALPAASPAEAASQADIVISIVADDEAARSVWLGAEGALAAASPEAVLIESSTTTVAWINELAEQATARGIALLDAPVTGSRMQAAAGQLNFLVGGVAATLERVRPVLEIMSRSITHFGPTGNGTLMKLINNFLCGIQIASLGEGLALIERAGLDRGQALEFLLHAAPGSPLLQIVAPRMETADYTPNFLLRLMTKDLVYANEEARRYELVLPVALAARDAFRRAVAGGHGDQDMAAIVEVYRQARGEEGTDDSGRG